jgi:hypothetical protein
MAFEFFIVFGYFKYLTAKELSVSLMLLYVRIISFGGKDWQTAGLRQRGIDRTNVTGFRIK